MSRKKGKATIKRILLVEDDEGIIPDLCSILDKYKDQLEVIEAGDAGEALRTIRESTGNQRLNALVLDIMLPYGTAKKELEADDDIHELETGMRMLKWLRDQEVANKIPHLWVAVITARSKYAVQNKVENLLGSHGKLYLKPFDTIQFEDDLVKAIGIESKVDPILLPNDAEMDDQEQGEILP
ncbi:MAG: hypothetical protein ABIK28_08955 [Planctomycetota bacterium]